MRRSSAAASVLAALLASGGVSAATPDATAPAHRAHAILDAARAALAAGGIADAVRFAAETTSTPVRPLPALAPRASERTLPAPLADLAAAVRTASLAAQRAILDPAEARRVAATVFRSLDLARTATAPGVELPDLPETPRARFVPPSTADRARTELLALERRIGSIVDLPLMYSGAAQLAAAVDAALPRLRELPSTAPRRTAACDLHRSTDLCVSSDAAHTYSPTDEFALIVDLGGDDVYQNSAGGCLAPILSVSGKRYASAVVDVAGDDRYESVAHGPLTLVSGPPVQGACFGGVGMLVDALGNDTYIATSDVPGTKVHAQGMSLIGAGVLADLDGTDTYTLDDPFMEIYATDEWAKAGGSGQGVGVIGMGIALDRGLGDDRTSIVSTPDEPMVDKGGWLQPSQVNLSGFGTAALGGVGIHHDDGGADSQSIMARSAPVAPDDPRKIRAPWASVGGWGEVIFGGVGIQVTGDGPTERIARAESSGPVVQLTNIYAMASGGFGALAALGDAGGDDRYIATASARAETTGSLDDACGCPGRAVWAIASPFWSQMITHAAGGLISGDTGNVLLLHDAGGDDEYVATLDSTASVSGHDARTELLPPPDDDPDARVGLDVIAWSGVSMSRSLGTGFSNGAYAALEDDGGRDTYRSGARNVVDARVTAHRPDAEPESSARSDGVRAFSQGYGSHGGFGMLRDTGGGDAYRSSLIESVTAEPDGIVQTGEIFNLVQGAGDILGFGSLIDLEGGATDSFAAVPELKICGGTYGVAWVGCGTGGGGAGVNA